MGHVYRSRWVKRSTNSLPSSIMVRSAVEVGIKHVVKAHLLQGGDHALRRGETAGVRP